jgi:hypothetical protein
VHILLLLNVSLVANTALLRRNRSLNHLNITIKCLDIGISRLHLGLVNTDAGNIQRILTGRLLVRIHIVSLLDVVLNNWLV